MAVSVLCYRWLCLCSLKAVSLLIAGCLSAPYRLCRCSVLVVSLLTDGCTCALLSTCCFSAHSLSFDRLYDGKITKVEVYKFKKIKTNIYHWKCTEPGDNMKSRFNLISEELELADKNWPMTRWARI
jgi:hypothetical protein